MRAIFFCAAALSVTWRDLVWDFFGGAMVAADARVAGSRTPKTMRRLKVATLFIIRRTFKQTQNLTEGRARKQMPIPESRRYERRSSVVSGRDGSAINSPPPDYMP